MADRIYSMKEKTTEKKVNGMEELKKDYVEIQKKKESEKKLRLRIIDAIKMICEECDEEISFSVENYVDKETLFASKKPKNKKILITIDINKE